MSAASWASIPSPSSGAVHIGSFQLRGYGLMIALGVIAAVSLAGRRWQSRGGDANDISRLALWAVPGGLIGARAYHVITDPELFRGRWLHVFAIWEGGLGIPGGIAAGVATGAWVAHRRGLPVATLLDVVAPALPLAQGIGRWGNWFNQELFGRPSHLPWAVRIDAAHRPDAYLHVATFHPTFLYESVWDLALVVVLLGLERRWHRPSGRLFGAYIAGYGLGRLWVESLRIDYAHTILGLRVNTWISVAAIVAGTVVMAWPARHRAAIS